MHVDWIRLLTKCSYWKLLQRKLTAANPPPTDTTNGRTHIWRLPGIPHFLQIPPQSQQFCTSECCFHDERTTFYLLRLSRWTGGQDYLKSYKFCHRNDRSVAPNIVVMMKDPLSALQIQSVRFLISTQTTSPPTIISQIFQVCLQILFL